jgi:hypothetical protein
MRIEYRPIGVVQIVFGGLKEIGAVQTCRDGCGERGSVAIKAMEMEPLGGEMAFREN